STRPKFSFAIFLNFECLIIYDAGLRKLRRSSSDRMPDAILVFRIIVACILHLPLTTHHSRSTTHDSTLHSEYLFLLIQKLILYHLTPWFCLFKFFNLFVESFAVFDNGHTTRANEFNQSIWLQSLAQPVCFFTMPSGFKYCVIFPDHYGSCTKLTKQALYFYFLRDFIGGYFVKGEFLPNNFFASVEISLQYFNLLFYLATKFPHYFLGFINDNGEPMNGFHF